MLDVSACLDGDNAAVFLVNRSMTDDLDVEVSLADRRIELVKSTTILTGDDPKAHNTWDDQDVIKPETGAGSVGGSGGMNVSVPSLGLVVLEVDLESISKIVPVRIRIPH